MDDIPNPWEERESIFETRVQAIDGLPAFPSNHSEILKLAKSEHATSDEIATKVQLDPGLLAHVFKLVNFSAYGISKPVHSLNLAISLIGVEELSDLVTTVQVFEQLGEEEDTKGPDLKAFWEHTVETAFAARAIAKKLQIEVESAFLAGILHDLGKIVLDR